MKKIESDRFFRGKFTAVILGAIAFSAIACNNSDHGNLKVSGGTADVKGTYAGTVYVDMTGQDFNGSKRTIRNVGNFVDLGLEGKLTLVLSLADAFVTNGGISSLPVFKTVDLKIYLSNGTDAITIPGLAFQADGSLQDANKNRYTILAVGLEAKKVGPSDPADAQIAEAAQKIFHPSPLRTAKGLDVREPITTYELISIPRSVHPAFQSLKAPTLVTSDASNRQLTNLVMVGFGDTSVGRGTEENAGNGFGLSAELPTIARRNYANVTALNVGDKSTYTPLRKLWGDSPAVVQQVWEVTGSGLCGARDKDQSNYDTGAGVYSSPTQLVGFAVRSTNSSKLVNYRGALDCTKAAPHEMATVVVSPNSVDIARFKSLVK